MASVDELIQEAQVRYDAPDTEFPQGTMHARNGLFGGMGDELLRRQAGSNLRTSIAIPLNGFRPGPLAGADSHKTFVGNRIHGHAQSAMIVIAERHKAEGLQ